MIAVSQDPKAQQGRAVFLSSAPGGSVFNPEKVGAWVKPLANGDVAVLVVNHGRSAVTVSLTRAQLGLASLASSVLVSTDLWSNATGKIAANKGYTATLAVPDGFAMVRIAAATDGG